MKRKRFAVAILWAVSLVLSIILILKHPNPAYIGAAVGCLSTAIVVFLKLLRTNKEGTKLIAEPLTSSNSQASPDVLARIRKLSIGDVEIFAMFFVVFFVAVHFDALGRAPRVRHDVPIGKSLWVALPIAIIGTVVAKLKKS